MTTVLNRLSEAQALDLLREQHDHIDPQTGAVLWQLTAEDVHALECALWDDDGAYLGSREGEA